LKDQLSFEVSSRRSVVRLILVDADGDDDLSQGRCDLRSCWDKTLLNFGDKKERTIYFRKAVRKLHIRSSVDKTVSEIYFSVTYILVKLNSMVVVRKRTIPTERPAKLVPTFVDRGCFVVSATNSHGR
jgi:hypothetical protein